MVLVYEKSLVEKIFLRVLNKYFKNKTFTISKLRKRIQIYAKTELNQKFETHKLARKLNDLVIIYQKIGIERLDETRRKRIVYKYVPRG